MTVTTVGATSRRVVSVLNELDAELARWQTPGLSVAVVDDGQVLYAGGTGIGSVAASTGVGAETLFHHGSCCKAYTALLAAVLHESDVVDLDAPVRAWVPELRLPDEDVAAGVTLRDLLSHRSGLSRHDLVWILNPSWDGEELVRRLRHLPLAAGLRERWEYSNLGYALAGLAIERATGSTWADQLREHVLGPLGMHCSTTSATRLEAVDAASPHVLRAGEPTVVDLRELVGAAPAGSLMTSAADAARWLLLQVGALDGVSAKALAATHQMAMDVPPGMQPFPQLELGGYALGWLLATFRGHPVLYHSGGIDGFSTQTFILPDQRAGVTVSANMHGSLLPMAAALQIVDALLDTTESTSWSATLHPMLAAALAAADQQTQTVGTPRHDARAIAGTYRHLSYGDLVLTADGDRVLARLGESELTARPLSEDTWELRYDPLDAGYPVTVTSDADGHVSAIIAPFDPTSASIVFDRQATS